MSKGDSMILNLTNLIASTPDKEILALDIEGAPLGVNQISCVNGKGKQTVNQFGTKPNHFSPGVLNEDQKIIIKNVLKKTKILIGYNISSDITALTRQGIDVSLNIVIVDLYLTMLHLIEKGLIEKLKLSNLTLKGVAEYYGIRDVSGYHDSRVDAKITMRIFHTIYKAYHGMFWAMTNYKNAAIANGMNKPTTNEIKEDIDMSKDIDWIQEYSKEADCEVYKAPQGFYEALVPIKDTKQIVRMSQNEYDMYLKIRQMAPGYPLRVFYLTILAPGIVSAIQYHEEIKAEMPEQFPSITELSEKRDTNTQQDTDITPLIDEEMVKMEDLDVSKGPSQIDSLPSLSKHPYYNEK